MLWPEVSLDTRAILSASFKSSFC